MTISCAERIHHSSAKKQIHHKKTETRAVTNVNYTDSFLTRIMEQLRQRRSLDLSGCRVSSSIRRTVRFSMDDPTSTSRIAPVDSVFGSFDLVLCRNVLIYYSADLGKRILDKLYRSLDNRGWMVFGDSEGLDTGAEPRLIAVDGKNRIYRKPE